MRVIWEPVSTRKVKGPEPSIMTEVSILEAPVGWYLTGAISPGHPLVAKAARVAGSEIARKRISWREVIEVHLSRNGWVNSADVERHGRDG